MLPSEPLAPKLSGKTVLVVEDDDFIRDLFVTKLSSLAYNVETAKDGQEALAKIKTLKPSLVLLDLVLPKMDGFEVLGLVRDDPALISIPIVVLSNLGEPKDIAKAKGLGARDYIIKANYTPSEVAEKIAEFVF